MKPSQNLVRSGGFRPYHRKRESIHYRTPSFVLFTVDGCNISHDPVFFTRHKRRDNWAGALTRVSYSASSDRLAFRLCNSSLPYLRNLAWHDALNSSWTLSAATRCPVMTQDDFQLSGAASVGSGRSRPACFTGKRVTTCPGFLLLCPGRGLA